jgi:hypothetical protein
MKVTRLLAGCVLASMATAISAHDLRGIVAEENSLDATTRQKFADIAQLKQLLAQRAKAGENQLEAVVRTALRWDGNSISVCFMDGSSAAYDQIAAAASDWSQGTAVRFDFGSAGARRRCNAQAPSDIRVSFGPGGYWGYVGTSGRQIPADRATLNLERLDHPGPLSDYERSVVLHEFGHALGFEHEHQSPKSGCQEEFNWDYLYASMGWPPEKVRFNMARFDQSNSLNGLQSTAFDRDSVMLYSLESRAFKNPDTATCLVRQANLHLSVTDLSAASYLYPSIPQVGAMPAAPSAPAAVSNESVELAQRLRALTQAR